MRRWVVVACLAGAGAAAAAPGDERAVTVAAPPTAVIGGTDVPGGTWRDTAAVLVGRQQFCSGVLVAPTVVLTADHCRALGPDQVLLGTNSLARPSAGEIIDVTSVVAGPGAFDVALLMLARPARETPRRLATGWLAGRVVDGAAVELVGYGAVDRDGSQFVDELRQAQTTITDAGCTRSVGCEPAVQPAGELGAGGGGVDTCPGDSGGPLYLLEPTGPVLAGITSRGYDSNQFPCSEGGIYVRPDHPDVKAWIEQAGGVELEDGLHPLGEPMTLAPGTTDAQRLDANDPYGAAHAWVIEAGPATGTAAIAADGTLTVTAPMTEGDATVVVRATDTADPSRHARVRIALAYREDAGCCSTGDGGVPAAPAAIAIAALVRRRRRTP